MLPVLNSLDQLLNRFDQLSQQHAGFKLNFEKNFSDIDNPLRDVARNENEQKKTVDNLSTLTMRKDEKRRSSGTMEDFHRRIIKNRYHHRPPNYCSNENGSFLSRTPSRTSLDSTQQLYTPALSLIQTTITTNTRTSILPTSFDHRKKQKSQSTTKIAPKICSVPRTRPRTPIKTFSMETVDRLSQSKLYHLSSDEIVPSKRARRRPKLHQNIIKEVSKLQMSSIKLPPVRLPPPPPPTTPMSFQTKRTSPITIKPLPKKLKTETSFSRRTSQRPPTINCSRSNLPLTIPPPICLNFPMQPELNPSRIVIVLKAPAPRKPLTVFTNRKTIIPFQRMKYLMA
ncbi:unnamed protein product [Adineta ricciae]|uniref:Uncharacterized protein n=1 Tax=Adineta ricciae TaxID=249248 RepID=A0A814MST5_ADIRI|nr:unnamed protein product [Adineta ricciae]CAF1671916.1 unnamed protein product [Adineta ricciae]